MNLILSNTKEQAPKELRPIKYPYVDDFEGVTTC
jgi:hypothetical protein